ncbi:MAG: hypothetical protein LBR38_09975, partial [Synergistaceae bacterium]|nr:hypothetical protein [Synergistaceae bacterium]
MTAAESVADATSDERIKWHTAFVEAIRAEFVGYLDALEFDEEKQLTSEPLKIDVLIIKKLADRVIAKNIGRIFRSYNVVEYKSPDDYISVEDCQKVFAYAWLYASQNHVSSRDITVTFTATSYPSGLFGRMEGEMCAAVTETSPGIHVASDFPMTVQFVECGKLSEDENLWLKTLHKGIDAESLRKVWRMRKGLGVPLSAYLYVLYAANPRLVREVGDKDMTAEMRQALIDVGFA